MSGAVYQPTTVQYESNSPSDRWQERPISCMESAKHTSRRLRIKYLPNLLSVIIAVLFLVCVITTVVLFILMQVGDKEISDNTTFYSVIPYITSFFLVLSVVLLGLLAMISRSWRNVKDHIGTTGGQNLTVNPSTDLLVTAQYAPISEVVYESAKTDYGEQSKLMSQDNKEFGHEDDHRFVENDPRIVLRPLNAAFAEET